MHLLSNVAQSVIGLAGIGLGSYLSRKGSKPNAIRVSEVKAKLKKRYPFLDESSLKIISRRFVEEYKPINGTIGNNNNSNQVDNQEMSFKTTQPGTKGTTTSAYNNQLAQKLKLPPNQVNDMAQQVQDTTGLNLVQLRQLMSDPNS